MNGSFSLALGKLSSLRVKGGGTNPGERSATHAHACRNVCSSLAIVSRWIGLPRNRCFARAAMYA